MIGQIHQLPTTSPVPGGWAACAGQTLPVSNYISLYSIIGNAYGGSGPSTFRLPDLPAPTGTVYVIELYGMFPSFSS